MSAASVEGSHGRKITGPLVICLSLAAGTAILYLPMFNADFVYDSRSQILIDGYIHDPRNLPDVLSLNVLTQEALDNARPVHLLSLMLDSFFWEKDPLGYHLTNILLHIACSVALFFLIHRLSGEGTRQGMRDAAVGEEQHTLRPWLCGAIGAFFFAFHPVNSEAVCEVSYREDLLATFFLLMALHLGIRFSRRSGFSKLGVGFGCVLACLLSVGSKETGLAAPLVLLGYWLLYRPQEVQRGWPWLLLASTVVTVSFLVARLALNPTPSWVGIHVPTWLGGSFGEMLKLEPRLWALSLGLIIWPVDLCADYGLWSIRKVGLSLSLLVLVLVLVVQVVLARRNKTLALAFAIYWLGYLPVSNLVPIYVPLADHFLYLPMVGVCLALAGLAAHPFIWRTGRPLLLIGIVLMLVIGLGHLTSRRAEAWSNRVRLWEDTLQKNPRSYTAANNLGFARLMSVPITITTRWAAADPAVQAWTEAIRLSNGQAADSWAGLAIGLWRSGKSYQAEEAYSRAIQLDARYGDPDLLVKSLLWEPDHARLLKAVRASTSHQPPPVKQP